MPVRVHRETGVRCIRSVIHFIQCHPNRRHDKRAALSVKSNAPFPGLGPGLKLRGVEIFPKNRRQPLVMALRAARLKAG
jgi:hypothetical protein